MSPTAYVERPDSRRRGQRALEAFRADGAAARRRLGAETGWHASGDWRLDSFTAGRVASTLERRGWRAEAVLLAQGIATVEVRALAVRGMPLVARLRTEQEARDFLREHPDRRPAAPVLPRGTRP